MVRFRIRHSVGFPHFPDGYSCILQAYIQGIRGDKLASFFYPDDESLSKATAIHRSHEFKNLEAIAWMKRDLGFATIPWLKDYEHGNSMEIEDTYFPELLAYGTAGYLTIFVADLV